MGTAPCRNNAADCGAALTDPSNYHAYTDGTDTIIGTSLEEAIEAYADEIDEPASDLLQDHWRQLPDSDHKTITMQDEAGQPKERRTVREWIDLQITENPDHFSRLLCSTEY